MSGKIQYYTLPPEREKVGEVSIVAEFGKEFDVDEVYKTEETSVIGNLSSAVDLRHMEVPPRSPPALDNSMLLPEEEQVNHDDEEDDNRETDSEDNHEDDVGDDDMGVQEDARNEEEKKVKRVGRGQNAKLYTAEGILDPRVRRAEKKKSKKARKVVPADMEADYDFKVDFFGHHNEQQHVQMEE